MRKLLNTYFSISKREFNGLLALVVLIATITAVPNIYDSFVPNDRQGDTALSAKILVPTLPLEAPIVRRAPPKVYSPELFLFDPNTIGQHEWQRLGLSERQSAAIINYRTKGGKFRKPEDLRKMYTISEKMYNRVLPYVRIAPVVVEFAERTKPLTHTTVHVRKSVSIIEINSADSVSLLEIRGVGPAFASRIIKYRQRIGGYSEKEQLMEIFGIDSVKFNEIKDQVRIDLAGLRKLNINTVQIEDFKNHPYVRYKQANAIIQYRKQHGNFGSAADLSKVLILDPETITRLAPYLIF